MNTTLRMNTTHTCNFSHHHDVWIFNLTLVLNIGGTILTVLSIIFSSVNNAIDPSLRGILISFSTANLFGTMMLMYDTIVMVCYSGRTSFKMGVVISTSITLTVSHLMFLLLAEYIILTSIVKRSVKDFTGLIIVGWIISICIGSIMMSTQSTAVRATFITIFVLLVLLLIHGFTSIVKRSKNRLNALEAYERKYLNLHHRKSRVVKRYWRLRYFAIILMSYAACSSLWVAKEIYELTRAHGKITILDSTVLLIYTISFYFPSIIIIFLWYKRYRERKQRNILYAFARQTKMLGAKKDIGRYVFDDSDIEEES